MKYFLTVALVAAGLATFAFVDEVRQLNQPDGMAQLDGIATGDTKPTTR